MRVIVLGAGVVGTAASWYLAKAGHEVTVIERQDAAGMETSFANGGQVSPCHAEPWANPAVIGKIVRWLGREDAPLVFRWGRWDPALWLWGIKFLANCTAARTSINIERTLRVAIYSRECLRALRAETGIEYDQRTQGILHVYRNPKEYESALTAGAVMSQFGLPRSEQNPAECVAIEPALGLVQHELAGGIFTPDDESGDAHKFTQELAKMAAERGVKFKTGVNVQAIEKAGDRIIGIKTDKGREVADAYVVALGSYSPLLLRPLGIRIPIVPAKGYSITVPVNNHTGAPTVSITDDEHKMVYSRLGNRLRAAGTAEMAGWNPDLNEVRWRVILRNARSLFPDGGDYDQAEPWAGLRPVTPDSVPFLGRTTFKNLFLDTGHGTLGWTMSCGSGRVIADLVSGREPDIDMRDLSVDRL